MAGADGSIWIKIKADDEQAHKQLAKLNKDIEKTKKSVESLGQKKIPIETKAKSLEADFQTASQALEELKAKSSDETRLFSLKDVQSAQTLGAELDRAKETLEFMRSGEEFFPDATIESQAEKVKLLQKDFESAAVKAERSVNAEIKNTEKQIVAQEAAVKKVAAQWEYTRQKLADIDTQIQFATDTLTAQKIEAGELEERVSSVGYKAGAVMEEANKKMDTFTKRLKGLVKRVFIFSLFTTALRSVKDWFFKVIQTNEEAVTAIGRLKGALLALVQPLVSFVIPAFVSFLNILTRIVTAVASMVSALFGTTVEQSSAAAESLYQEAEAINATGTAAKKASKSLASFDEINQLASENASGSTETQTITPVFDIQDNGFMKLLENMLPLIEAIGAAMLYWKLPTDLQNGITTIIGLFLFLDGAVRLVRKTFDAWTNGVDWNNLLSMLLAVGEVALGLYLVFGLTGLGIGLVVGGLVMLVTAFHDAFESGLNLKNLLMAIAGILLVGAGISVLVGNWIPLAIAAIAALLLAIVYFTGRGEDLLNGLKDVFSGFLGFISGVFTGDLGKTLAGIEKMFEGLKKVVVAIFDSLIDIMPTCMKNAATLVKDIVVDLIDTIKEFLTGLIQFLVGVFTGDWEMAWKGIVNMGISLLNGLVGAIESVFGFISRAINNLINAINAIISGAGDLVGADWKGISWRSSAPSFGRIPLLAQGAVIPPNREFLAVLGDQKSGTNIETPLSTMVAAFKQAINESGMNDRGGGDVILQIDGKTFARVTNPYYKSENSRIGVKMVNGV